LLRAGTDTSGRSGAWVSNGFVNELAFWLSDSLFIESFISRWENSGAADPAKNLHVFDRAITRVNPDGSSVTNYIDLYKARHFVCETKQGVWETDTNVAAVYDKRVRNYTTFTF
jgi:hypothetical protein